MPGESTSGGRHRRGIMWRVVKGVVATGVVAVFITATAGGIAALQHRADSEAPPKQHPPITVTTNSLAIQDHYVTTSRYVGTLEPARETSLAFEQGGLVIEVNRDEGEVVRAGDAVARLDTDRLKAARLRLEAAKRELEAERTLAELTLTRQTDLRQKGWSPQQREDEAVASVARLSAAIDRVAGGDSDRGHRYPQGGADRAL